MKQPDCLLADTNHQAAAKPATGTAAACRAFELDALRGLALVLMVLHHFIFDLRYLFHLNVFAFQETWWFENLMQPFFLNVFIVVSGICCTFSRSNTKRGLRLLAVALGFTAVTSIASTISGMDFYIIFNVLHLLALGTLLYSGLTWSERKNEKRQPLVDVAMLLLAAALLYFKSLLSHWADIGNYWLLPIGLPPADHFGMADYLPIVPWLGFFLIGAVIGRTAYASRQSAFPGVPRWFYKTSQPFGFVGRHSLVVYAIHQPILLAALYGLRMLHLI